MDILEETVYIHAGIVKMEVYVMMIKQHAFAKLVTLVCYVVILVHK